MSPNLPSLNNKKMQSSLVAKIISNYDGFRGPTGAVGTSSGPVRKRRLEEILDYNVEFGVLNGMLRSKRFRPDMASSRERYMQDEMSEGELSLPYTRRGQQLHGFQRGHLMSIPHLSIPAFGTDPVEELPGKFDLVMNTITSLYTSTSPPIEHNKLLFQFMGLNQPPYAIGEERMDEEDALTTFIQMDVYSPEDSVLLGDGQRRERRDLVEDLHLRQEVDEAFRLHLTGKSMDPVATLIPFNLLQQHIMESNKILQSQYGNHMKGRSLSELKSEVIDQHGRDSVVALMIHMESPEMFYDTFLPRGICSSACTGKMVPSSSGKFIVTLQTTGTLNVDVEDGDSCYEQGTMIDNAYLYLIVEMRELISCDDKFNYPWIRMLLTSKTLDQVESDLLLEVGGNCVKSKTGQVTRTVIKPIAKIRVGPYHVHHPNEKDARQHYQFDIIMNYRSGQHRLVSFPMKIK